MSVGIPISEVKKKLAIKLQDELNINEGKQPLKLYIIDKPSGKVWVPYYHGKLLCVTDKPFEKSYGKVSISDVSANTSNKYDAKFDIYFELLGDQPEVLKECLDFLYNDGCVILKACTGFGKSIAIMYSAFSLGKLTIVYVTRDIFCKQLKQDFCKMTNAVVWEPHHKSKVPPANVQVIIVMPGRFHYVPENLVKQVGTLIVDEVQTVSTFQNVGPLLSIHPQYVMGCSATPTRRGVLHPMLKTIFGPNRVIRSLETPLRVIKWNTGIRIPYFQGGKGADWSAHVEYVCTCEERHVSIAEFVGKIIAMNSENSESSDISDLFAQFSPPKRKENESDEQYEKRKQALKPPYKIIGLTGNVKDHIPSLKEVLLEKGISCDHMDAKKPYYDECDILLGHPSKVGVGFDQKATCRNFSGTRINVVFQFLSCKSVELAEQEVGRGCRADLCFLICMVDNNQISKNHWNKGMLPFLETLDDVEILEYPNLEKKKRERKKK